MDIEDVVRFILWTTKRPKSERKRYLELVIWAYRDMCLNHVKDGIKVTKQAPTSINTVPFPDDMEDFVAVGEPVNGKFIPYSRRDDIIITTTVTGSIESLDPSDGEGVDINDQMNGGFSASGGANIYGYYRVDEENRRLFLNKQTRSEVILIYKTSGVKLSETTYVPKKYLKAIINFVLWQDSLGDDNKIGVSTQRQINYNHAIQEIKEREFSIDDLMDEIYRGNQLSPRR